ncbi:MAG: cell division protein FtsW [Candidatus Yonathbacteria bacterium]|nr:cell division protein FtsW [Candidatus Yonathbacteria bacterium]
MKKVQSIDKVFLGLTLLLALGGLFVFTSASFGLFVRKGFSLYDLLFDQVVLGLVLGLIAMYGMSRAPLQLLRTYALPIFIGAILFTLLVFVPHIGFAYGGAHRWISFGPISFQPSELLKLGTVIYFAALLPVFKDHISTLKYAVGVSLGVLVVPAIILLAEPDTGTFAVLLFAVVAMLLAMGMKFRHFGLLFLLSVVLIAGLAFAKPYVMERLLTFFDSSRDPQGSSYQIQKSLVAIGSGGITGRGFGQSIQKFGSLPEPTGDSVFAVVGEEFGLIGGGAIILLFLLFGIRGLQIARKAPDMFESLLAVGIVILIVSQSFANIAAMLGLIPLTGVPLVFVSHGGSALLFAFVEIGILLNISKSSKA